MYKDELSLRLNIEDIIEIIDNMYDGFLLTSLDGRIFYANKAVEDISGISLDEIIGRTANELIEAGIILDQSISVGANESITMIHKLKTGREILITSKPIYDSSGRFICFVANYRNLSRLHTLKKSHELAVEKRKNSKTSKDYDQKDWIGESLETIQLKEKVAKIAKTEAIVLISGESGVGKEVVAKHLHKLSERNKQPFVQINCAAIPEELMEAELFGYEKGAFTGATSAKKGLFEVANGGTVLLDEIGEMPLSLQTKLLRTLQTKTITRLGGTSEIKLDVRFIAATNKDLYKEVERGNFREDLYYRLNVIPLHIVPLRHRKEDIIPLANYFLEKFNRKYQSAKLFAPETLQIFYQYHWPGNVRQLQNIIERLVIMTDKEIISPFDLPTDFKVEPNTSIDYIKPLSVVREEAESRMIQLAIKKYGSIRKAAKYLQVDHSTIVRKIKKYNIHIPENSYTC